MFFFLLVLHLNVSCQSVTALFVLNAICEHGHWKTEKVMEICVHICLYKIKQAKQFPNSDGACERERKEQKLKIHSKNNFKNTKN